MTRSRTLSRSLAASALAVPLVVSSVAAPASAAVGLADHWSPYPPAYGFVVPPPGWDRRYGPSSATTTYAGLDVSDASAEQSEGLVEVTAALDGGTAAGSGIVLSSDGLVVTNQHVVEGASQVVVTVVTTGETYAADVVGSDEEHDVAVLRLEDAQDVTAVTTAAGTLAPGDAVTAVGDAGGDGGSLTAAPGTVTALHEPITVTDEQTGETSRLRNLVEVTSDIVPGDSGGALLDADGAVVGMSVAAASGGGEVTGYVIPIGRVLRVADGLTP